MSAHPATGRSNVPFAFPFTPLGFSLFDTDPSRILSMLHHQTMLAEEALRYRELLFSSPKDPIRFSSISEILSSKEQDKQRSTLMYKSQFNANNITKTNIGNVGHQKYLSATTHYGRPSPASAPPTPVSTHQCRRESSILDELKLKSEETVQKEEEAAELELALKSIHKESSIMSNRLHRDYGLNSYPSLIDATSNTLRYLSGEMLSAKEKSSSSSTSSTPPPGNKSATSSGIGSSASFTTLYDSEPIEEETHCVQCNANFPNVWLLEQHAALQHPADPDEKPFICEQCGQSYRYRSAYAKHKEQNHRARLPADKLFTCDVCGMQFRYLKSFKKHRLNHALERLHGKKDRRIICGENQDVVTSTIETSENEVTDLRINIKREKEEEQDNTVDSAGAKILSGINFPPNSNSPSASSEPKISSSAEGVISYSTNNRRPRIMSPLINEPESSSTVTAFNHLQQYPTATALATTSIASLINAERIPNEQLLGLNPQEASILNFLRVDAAERQRDKRNPASRFACPFCGKCVRSKENLKLHVRKHTGERPFVCLFCGRAFGGKSDLTRHLRIHTGERPYHCESCGKCFARADYLSKHLTTHIHNAPR